LLQPFLLFVSSQIVRAANARAVMAIANMMQSKIALNKSITFSLLPGKISRELGGPFYPEPSSFGCSVGSVRPKKTSSKSSPYWPNKRFNKMTKGSRCVDETVTNSPYS
jgi:hypothetical protein